MIERLCGKVEKVTFIKNVGQDLDLCEIQIDFDVMKIFYETSELMQFINCEVQYTTRQDVIDAKIERIVCELVKLSNIQTVQSTENIKLIPEGSKRTVCNVESKDFRFGEFYPNCVALMTKHELGSSPRAKWFDCTMIDTSSREFMVRLFASNIETNMMNELLESFHGRYVAFDLECTKYGYQTKEIAPLPNEVEQSPEVLVATEVIKTLIESDPALMAYNTRYSFLDNISSIIDGEPGYALVRMASELYMINAIDNISTDLDIRAMKRAVICSRGYLLPHKMEWSRPMLNINKALQIADLKADREVMIILDVLSGETPSDTKLTYLKIRGLVNDIIKIRRGISDEENASTFANVNALFNGLL